MSSNRMERYFAYANFQLTVWEILRGVKRRTAIFVLSVSIILPLRASNSVLTISKVTNTDPNEFVFCPLKTCSFGDYFNESCSIRLKCFSHVIQFTKSATSSNVCFSNPSFKSLKQNNNHFPKKQIRLSRKFFLESLLQQ